MNKIGRKTLGLLFLLVGGIFLVQQWSSIGFSDMFGYIWPILFVAIIIEVFYHYRLKEPEEPLRFDKGAIVVLVLALLISGGVQNTQSSGFGTFQGSSIFNWWDEGISVSYEESIDINQHVSEIHFDIPNAKLRIVGTDEDQLVINGTVRANENNESNVMKVFEKARITESKGDSFLYHVERPKSSWFSFNDHLHVDFVVSIPRDRMVDVDVTNGSVDIVNIDENIIIKTTNGRVSADEISGDALVSNTNGTISLRNISGEVEAVTTNGRVSVNNIYSNATIKTTNGTIDLESIEVNGNWDVATTNGNVTLRIPQDSDVSVEGKTTNGSVSGDLDWIREKDTNFFGKSNEGSAIHNQGTYQISTKGTNGSISVSLLE
ncbi:DUF4097 family beta strand repeat-containing protein [Salipaludibacillus sp. HK11]|uniref:DUF4097 family beta strand repeat-containing protein n=1 Tax=Salipaludibacillus sp. HK11 TaxID=3394320 RepID=UPI0039FCA3CE